MNFLPQPTLDLQALEPPDGLDPEFVDSIVRLARPLGTAAIQPVVEVAGPTHRLRSGPPGSDRFVEALSGLVDGRFWTVWMTAREPGLLEQVVVRRYASPDADRDDGRSGIEVSATFSFAWWADREACDATVAAVASLATLVDDASGFLGANGGLESIYGSGSEQLGLRGYGWLTILEPRQVKRLGGIDRVRERAPVSAEPIIGATAGQPGALLRGSPVMASFIGPPARSLRRYLQRFIPNGDRDLMIEEAQAIIELGGSFSA